MDLIREMAHVIEKDRPKSFSLLIPKDSKLRKLYQLALNPKLSEADISTRIYKSKPGDKRFLMLKGNLINKLSELILIGQHSDVNKNNYIKVQFECDKQLTIARKLLFVNVYHNAEKIVKKTLKVAIRYHLTSIEAECYTLMRKINYLKGFKDETEQFHQLSVDKLKLTSKINEARGMTEVFLAEVKFLRSQSKAIAKKCSQYILSLIAYDAESPFIALAILRIRLIKSHQENDLEAWNQTLEELHEFIRNYPHLLTEHLLLEYQISIVKYNLAISDFKTAKKSINALQKFTSFEAFNHFEVLAESFLLHCRQGNLKQANKILNEVFESLQFDMLDSMDKAAWVIRASYLFLAVKYSEQDIDIKWFSDRELTSFFNTCKPITKDKAGYNLQFVIIRILLLHSKESIDYASEHNSLKVYHSRYLKRNLPVRSSVFYNILTKLIKANFKRKSYDDLTKELKKKLKEHPSYIEHCELFQYEELWEVIGKTLRK